MSAGEKTSVFENGLIWFGAGVSLAEILTEIDENNRLAARAAEGNREALRESVREKLSGPFCAVKACWPSC